jgi:hypothetical protein
MIDSEGTPILTNYDLDWSTREITIPTDRPALVTAVDFGKVPPFWFAMRYGAPGLFQITTKAELNRLWRKVQAPLLHAKEHLIEDWDGVQPQIVVVQK